MAKCKVTMDLINGRSKTFIIPDTTSNEAIRGFRALPYNVNMVTFPSAKQDEILFVNMNLVTSINILEKPDYEDF